MSQPIRVEMHLGNCLEIMPSLSKIKAKLTFCDLPYGILKHRKWDTRICLNTLWKALDTITDKESVTAFTCNMAFASKIIISNEDCFRYDLVWQKTYASNFLLAKKRPLCVHENVLIFAPSKHLYNPQMRPESQRGTIVQKTTKIKNPAKWHQSEFYTVCTRKGPMYPIGVIKTKEPRSGKIHPTQKPVALLEWLVKTYTNSGDAVFDPCAGAFTTAVACVCTGRNFVGIELDSGYFAAGVERVKAEIAASGVNAEVVVYDKPKIAQTSRYAAV